MDTQAQAEAKAERKRIKKGYEPDDLGPYIRLKISGHMYEKTYKGKGKKYSGLLRRRDLDMVEVSD